ncbi:MAG: 30S ribosome-binding factor RbfA [Thermoguttaceae bacterium]|nr:30S ribosome-binding factor RbfA [Thermoguttaceae bacterium]
MASRRTLRAAEAIREVVAMAILKDLKDPRIQDVTVTGVEVAGDMKNAKVFVSVRGNQAKEVLAIKGLQNASGFLQQKCAERIETRYIPRLHFEIDEGIKNLEAVTRILEEEKARRADSESGQESDQTDSAPTDSSPQDGTVTTSSDPDEFN